MLILHDTQKVTSTAIRWLERYVKELKTNGSVLMLADINPAVMDVLKSSGALEEIGSENVFPATTRVLAAENMAWEAAPELAAAKS